MVKIDESWIGFELVLSIVSMGENERLNYGTLELDHVDTGYSDKVVKVDCDGLQTQLTTITAERNALKQKSNNHVETLKGVRDLITVGEIDRAILWITDGLSGCEPLESTLLKMSNEKNALRAALERLASSEAFGLPGYLGPEVKLRIEYARNAIKGR